MANILQRVAIWLIKITGDTAEAKAALKELQDSSEETATEVGDDAEAMAKKQEEYSQALGKTIQVMSTATSAVSSTFSAYMNLQNTQDSAARAQEEFNEAVAKYGSNSEQAIRANERMDAANRRVAQSTFMFGANLLHTGSVLLTSGAAIIDMVKKMDLLAKAQALLNTRMATGVLALGAIAFFMLAINSESETMRNIFMVLTGVFVALTIAQMLYNSQLALTLGMTGVGLIAVAAGVAAMIGIVALQKKQAADIRAEQGSTMAELNSKMSDYEPGDIVINNYITAESIDWEAAPVLLEQISRRLQDNIETRCKTLGASL